MKTAIYLFVLFLITLTAQAEDWQIDKSRNFHRITDSIVRDINNDGRDEIIISSFEGYAKFIDVYMVRKGKLVQLDKIRVPRNTIFFDAGDIDNDRICDIVFLTPDGLYYHNISTVYKEYSSQKNFKLIPHIRSEIVVPQPELLTNAPMVIDLDGNGTNELIVENIRAIEIYETGTFSKTASLNLETILEFSIIPGEFYPHYIFYTLPIILVTDMNNDGRKEIITKFPKSMNIYSHTDLTKWYLMDRIYVGKDNVYFLSDSFVKFSFPVIDDLDSDMVKEMIISTANLDIPKIRFEAVGDIYYFDKYHIKKYENPIVLKGIPMNLPAFFAISDKKNKDLICPALPFNLYSIFSILSGHGDIKVPFLYLVQEEKGEFKIKDKKLFEIPFKIENIMSFVEELPFDQYQEGHFPDFYYFRHDIKNKKVDIDFYYYDESKRSYKDTTISRLDVPTYTPELPANLKTGYFTGGKRKDILFIIHTNFFIISRDN